MSRMALPHDDLAGSRSKFTPKSGHTDAAMRIAAALKLTLVGQHMRNDLTRLFRSNSHCNAYQPGYSITVPELASISSSIATAVDIHRLQISF